MIWKNRGILFGVFLLIFEPLTVPICLIFKRLLVGRPLPLSSIGEAVLLVAIPLAFVAFTDPNPPRVFPR